MGDGHTRRLPSMRPNDCRLNIAYNIMTYVRWGGGIDSFHKTHSSDRKYTKVCTQCLMGSPPPNLRGKKHGPLCHSPTGEQVVIPYIHVAQSSVVALLLLPNCCDSNPVNVCVVGWCMKHSLVQTTPGVTKPAVYTWGAGRPP